MLECQRHLFDLPESVTYLNCAYMSPQLKRVEAVGREMLHRKSRPYEIQVDDFFSPVETLKSRFAQLVNIADPSRIAVIPSVSYGMGNVISNIQLPGHQQILLAGEQFPSNVYPWRRLSERSGAAIVTAPCPESASPAAAWNEALLEAIGPDTAVVAISHTHWADGTVFDLRALRRRTREYGALLIIDGTQSVGALPFDVAAIEPDALVCAGYKWLLGPYSLGVAYYGPYFDQGAPIEENWINRSQSEDFRQLVNYRDAYKSVGARYSVGEQSNFMLTPMLSEAFAQLLEWGVDQVQDYCRALSAGPLAILREMGAVAPEESERAGHLFGIRLDERFDAEKLKRAFAEQQVFVSLRGSAIRVAPHLYNREVDFERLISCFKLARKKLVY